MALHGTVAPVMVGGPESGSDQVRFAPGRQSYPSISREFPGYGSFLLFGFWLLLLLLFSYLKIVCRPRPDN